MPDKLSVPLLPDWTRHCWASNDARDYWNPRIVEASQTFQELHRNSTRAIANLKNSSSTGFVPQNITDPLKKETRKPRMTLNIPTPSEYYAQKQGNI